MRRAGLAARTLAIAAAAALVAGCSIRQDATGTTRVGVFLWGLGDPPGVNWDLDWPRQAPPELPPMRPASGPLDEWRDRPPPGPAPQDR